MQKKKLVLIRVYSWQKICVSVVEKSCENLCNRVVKNPVAVATQSVNPVKKVKLGLIKKNRFAF